MPLAACCLPKELSESVLQELEAGILPSQNCHQHSHIHAAECSICMEADVEVAVDTCKHAMCLECAKAICAIPVRALCCAAFGHRSRSFVI